MCHVATLMYSLGLGLETCGLGLGKTFLSLCNVCIEGIMRV